MHVVQALVSLNVGGSELVATELSEFLVTAGHRVTVIAAEGPLGERVRGCGAGHLDWPIGAKRLSTLRAWPNGSPASDRILSMSTRGCLRGSAGWPCNGWRSGGDPYS